MARWRDAVEAMMAKGATPTAIYDCLHLEEAEFTGSLSAIQRLYARLHGTREVWRLRKW